MAVCAGVVKGQPIITIPPFSPVAEVGVAYAPAQFTATENNAPCVCTWSASGLTNGFMLSSTGVLTGPPTSPGSIGFTVTAFDGTTSVTTGTLSITVYAQISITGPATITGEQNVLIGAANYTVSGGAPTNSISLSGSLPAGLNFSTGANSATISGMPTAPAANLSVAVQVTDTAGGSASQPVTINIVPPPSVSTSSLPNGEVTVPYPSTPLVATGGAPPYTWAITAGTPPAGINLTNGVLGGTPTAAGSPSLTFQVTDSNAQTATATLTLTVVAAPTITTGSTLPQTEVGASYSQPLAATGGSGGGYSFALASGTLPGGLSLSSGSITGTPTTAVSSDAFSIKVTDSAGGFSTQNFTLTVIAGPTISTGPTLPQGEINSPYQAGIMLTATGGSNAGFTWSIVSGALPTGMNLNSAGAITGTPTASGPFSFTAKVTDSGGGSATQVFSLTIVPGPTITTAPTLPSGTAGVAYIPVMLAATGGQTPYTWSITAGALPAGMNLDGTSGTISGTPTASGPATFTIQVQDAKSVTGTKQFTLTVASGLTIVTAPNLPNGTIGQAYTLTLSVAGGTSPYTWAVTSGALPGGLTLSGGGTLSGVPANNGTFSFTVAVTDSASVTTSKSFTLTVASGLTITNAPNLPSGVVGGSYSQTLNATGGTSPYTWTVTSGALPGGLTFSSSGTLSGTPTTGGSFNFTVTVTDSASVSASKSFTLSIAALLAISTQPALPSGGVGTAYSQALTAVGGTAPYSWSVNSGALPGGLTLNPTSGAISGTPTTVGSFSFTVQVTDNNSVSTTKSFTLAIVSALTITTQPTLPGGAVGVAYSQSVVAVGGNSPYTWSISSGSLPAGLALAPASGAISGTPTAAGSFTFTVQVTDSASVKVNKAFSMSVVAGLTITTAPVLPSDSVGVNYTVTLSAAGGRAPYTFAVTSGGLPGGLLLDAKSGSIFGSPTASGSFGFTVTVTDTASNTSSKQFSIAIAAGLTITTAPALPNGAIGASYSQALDAVGGAAPYSWSVVQGALPPGLALTSSSGTISGTATSSGPFNFTVQVADSASATATKTFTLSISASLSIVTQATLPSGSVGVPYAATLAVAGGSSPYQWTITSGTPPAGITLNSSSGVLSGTPVGSGSFVFTVTVSDSTGHQAGQQFTLVIASGLTVTSPAQLPNASVNNPYSQTLTAAGGTPPYQWKVISGNLPAGLALSPGGVLSGTPSANGTFKFTVQVTDNVGATASLQATLNVGSGLAITSNATLPSGTPGQAYTALQLAAAGGRQPYTWAVINGTIAPGLSLSPAGSITGTPTTTGTFTFTAQVTDSNGATASLAFTISIVPPGLPQVIISGLPDTAASAQQINFDLALASGYPLEIDGTITLTFTPNAVAPAADPAIQLSTGGTQTSFKFPANSTNAVFSVPQIGLQTGTVAGAITLTFTLEAGGTALPTSGLSHTITIPRAAPTISAVKLVTGSNSFQVEVTGFSSPRELTEADLTFTPASGASLQTTSAVIDLTAVGKQWFQGAASAQFGSQFVLVMPFTASQGSISSVKSVTIKLKNSTGSSQSAGAKF